MSARPAGQSTKASTGQALDWLRKYESRNVTFIEPDGSWPIVWARAKGCRVWDLDGREYLDLTAAFGVAAAGHANSRVVKAGQRQMAQLPHAMGDVHPHLLKARLARELSRLTFERWTNRPRPEKSRTRPTKPLTGKTIFCNSGFEAVEAALKTARLATGRQGIVAFEGAYHGLGYGTLNATHREHFRGPFKSQLAGFGKFAAFPGSVRDLDRVATVVRRLMAGGDIGAVLVEPIQARGGINIPPLDFLPLLRRLCNERGALLILDEIYTGFGRTGQWFACEHSQTVPDLICLGKALTGGFPLSACIGRADLMDAAWPPSEGEAIHTSTFLGNPVGCAMALANLEEIAAKDLVAKSAANGRILLWGLEKLTSPAKGLEFEARGLGLMAGLEIRRRNGEPATRASLAIVKRLLREGYVLLPEGAHANVISFTPPLVISRTQIGHATAALGRALGEVASG